MLYFKCQNFNCTQKHNILPDKILTWINSENRRVFKCPYCMGKVTISMKWGYDNKNYLPIEKCEEGYLYLIIARNSYLGIFKKENIFFISRQKSITNFVDIEYHWDIGEPFGTAYPYFKLLKTPEFRDNNEKLKWLNKMEEIYWLNPHRNLKG